MAKQNFPKDRLREPYSGQPLHLAAATGAGILVEGLAVGRGEEPRDMAEPGEDAVHITPFAMGKHLMDPIARQPLRVGL